LNLYRRIGFAIIRIITYQILTDRAHCAATMATAISKPTSHPPKMKRPPPPFPQVGVNGVKAQQPSSSPPTTSKRLPGGMSSGSSPNLANGVLNVAGGAKGPLNRTRNMAQRPGDSAARVTRGVTRTSSLGNDNRVGKRCPEPYGMARPVNEPAMPSQSVRCANLILCCHCSQNYTLYSQEIRELSSISHRTSPSYTFSVRATRWKFPLQFGDEGGDRAHPPRHGAT
jgi:transcription factor SPT20